MAYLAGYLLLSVILSELACSGFKRQGTPVTAGTYIIMVLFMPIIVIIYLPLFVVRRLRK